jgi:RimJ/RimL family protein N-acetyltransferase
LLLRPHREDDAAYLVALNADPEVTRYTGDAGGLTDERAREVIARLQREAIERLGRMVVVDVATGERLGWCGLKREPEIGGIDLGYRFFRQHWGKGFATEAARACLDFGFGDLALEEILAWVVPENAASVRVLEKLGFRRTGATRIHGEEMHTYAMDRAGYAARALVR